METIFKYLKQASTWRGIATVVAGFGFYIAPEFIDAIAVAFGSVIGLIEVIRNEDKLIEKKND